MAFIVEFGDTSPLTVPCRLPLRMIILCLRKVPINPCCINIQVYPFAFFSSGHASTSGDSPAQGLQVHLCSHSGATRRLSHLPWASASTAKSPATLRLFQFHGCPSEHGPNSGILKQLGICSCHYSPQHLGGCRGVGADLSASRL